MVADSSTPWAKGAGATPPAMAAVMMTKANSPAGPSTRAASRATGVGMRNRRATTKTAPIFTAVRAAARVRTVTG